MTRALQEAERATGSDRIARYRGRRRVDDEEELAVLADLDPAGGAAVVGDRRSDRTERAVGGVDEAGDQPREGRASGCRVRVRDEELVRVRRAELATELAPPLRRRERLGVVRRAGGRSEPAVLSDGEAVDLGAGDARTRDPASVAAEQHLAGLGVVRQHVGRARNRPQVPTGVEPEARVVRVAETGTRTGVRNVDEIAVNADADRVDATGGDR